MKKVLLILPPIRDFYFTFSRNYPLGLLYLGTVLKNGGFSVSILNALETKKKISIEIPHSFLYLKRYYRRNKSPFKLFSGFYHFGLTFEEIEENIKKIMPDIVGISSNFACYFDSTIAIARLVKKIDKRIPVVVGGRFPTYSPELVLEEDSIDFLIRGEAEYSLLEFCKKLDKSLEGIEGLCYRVNNKKIISKKITIVSSLDSLPNPDRSLINFRNYRYRDSLYISMLASRGCRLRCRFCGIREPYRERDLKSIKEEIEKAYSLGIRHFNFEDDNITFHSQFEAILDFLIEDFVEKKKSISISFMNGLMTYALKKKILDKLIKCGITHLDLSLVSADVNLRKDLERKENVKKIFYVSDYMSNRNVPVCVHFIVGLPNQSVKSVLGDILYLSKEKVTLGPSIFYPVIESEMFKELKERFEVKEEDFFYFRSSCAYFEGSLLRDEIFSVFYLSRIINYVKTLIDKFEFTQKSFYSWLDGISQEWRIKNNTLIVPFKLKEDILGAILLKKLIFERKICRVTVERKDKKFFYRFIEEEFIIPDVFNLLEKGIPIRGTKSSQEIKLQGRITPLHALSL